MATLHVLCVFVQYLNYNATQISARLGQLQVQALDIIMLLWRANANPLKPAKLDHKDILPVDVIKDDNVIALLLSEFSISIHCSALIILPIRVNYLLYIILL